VEDINSRACTDNLTPCEGRLHKDAFFMMPLLG